MGEALPFCCRTTVLFAITCFMGPSISMRPWRNHGDVFVCSRWYKPRSFMSSACPTHPADATNLKKVEGFAGIANHTTMVARCIASPARCLAPLTRTFTLAAQRSFLFTGTKDIAKPLKVHHAP